MSGRRRARRAPWTAAVPDHVPEDWDQLLDGLPLVGGGQGRSSEEVRQSAIVLVVCLCGGAAVWLGALLLQLIR